MIQHYLKHYGLRANRKAESRQERQADDDKINRLIWTFEVSGITLTREQAEAAIAQSREKPLVYFDDPPCTPEQREYCARLSQPAECCWRYKADEYFAGLPYDKQPFAGERCRWQDA